MTWAHRALACLGVSLTLMGAAVAQSIHDRGQSVACILDGRAVRVELQQVTPPPRTPKQRPVPFTRLAVVDAADRSRLVWSVLASSVTTDPFYFPPQAGLEVAGDLEGTGTVQLVVRQVVAPLGAPTWREFEWKSSGFVLRRDFRLIEDAPGSGHFAYAPPGAPVSVGTWVIVFYAVGPSSGHTSMMGDRPAEYTLQPREILANIVSIDRAQHGRLGQAILTPDPHGLHVSRWVHPLMARQISI